MCLIYMYPFVYGGVHTLCMQVHVQDKDFSLSQELSDLARLAGHQALEIHLSLLF